MHRTTPTLAIAGGTPHQFGHHLVEVCLLLLRGVSVMVAVRVTMSVTTMGRGDEIILTQGGDGPHCHGFLTGVEMGCSFDEILSEKF